MFVTIETCSLCCENMYSWRCLLAEASLIKLYCHITKCYACGHYNVCAVVWLPFSTEALLLQLIQLKFVLVYIFSHGCFVQIHYLIETIRTPTRNYNPTFPVTHFPVVDINTGWCLYDNLNSAVKTFCQVPECLWWNGSSFFLQSCSQSS
jgi:hypothetical protein